MIPLRYTRFQKQRCGKLLSMIQNIEYKKLKNGANLIIVQNKNLQSITASVSFNVGIKDESNKKHGTSHLIEHLICQNKPLNQELDFLGATIVGSTYKETTNYLLQFIKKDFERVLGFFIESLINLDFNNDEIQKEKKIIFEEIAIRQNDYFVLVDDLLENLIYPSSYMGKPLLGTVNSIREITKEDLQAYYHKYYNPNNLAICLIGDIDSFIKNKAIQLIENWKHKVNLSNIKSRNALSNQVNRSNKHLIIKENASKQIEVAVGFKGFNLFDERKYFLRLLSIILGRGYNSRIFKKIREEKGLVYYLDTFCVEYLQGGYLEIKITIQKENLEKALRLIKEELQNLSINGIGEKELLRAKKKFQYETILNLEDPVILSEYLSGEMSLIGKILYPEKKAFRIVDRITLTDISKIISKILSKENMYIALVGNAKREEIVKCFK